MKTENSDAHGRGAGIVLGIMSLLLVVVLALPGFLAAGYSRINGGCYGSNGIVDWDEGNYKEIARFDYLVEYLFLVPSGYVMKSSPAARGFYNWQYRVAGGQYDLGR